MEATKIPKFNTILRIIGFIIVIPSVVGMLLAVLIFISATCTTAMTLSKTGSGIGATLSLGVSFLFGCSSLVGGVIGWFLIMQKKVYKCTNCGFILDRA